MPPKPKKTSPKKSSGKRKAAQSPGQKKKRKVGAHASQVWEGLEEDNSKEIKKVAESQEGAKSKYRNDVKEKYCVHLKDTGVFMIVQFNDPQKQVSLPVLEAKGDDWNVYGNTAGYTRGFTFSKEFAENFSVYDPSHPSLYTPNMALKDDPNIKALMDAYSTGGNDGLTAKLQEPDFAANTPMIIIDGLHRCALY